MLASPPTGEAMACRPLPHRPERRLGLSLSATPPFAPITCPGLGSGAFRRCPGIEHRFCQCPFVEQGAFRQGGINASAGAMAPILARAIFQSCCHLLSSSTFQLPMLHQPHFLARKLDGGELVLAILVLETAQLETMGARSLF
jgi:hypothetical protein